MYKKYVKRCIDCFLALIGLIILSPLYLLITIIIKIDSKGPVLFKQKRIKQNKKYFNILKFRTMRTDTPQNVPTHQLNNPDAYITKVGKILRKYSLDEIPQLVNILKGDMSIIGPRPALWNQYDLIEKRDKYGANNIRPGLTGLAQISGRDELPIDVKAMLDGQYVTKMSFIFDVKMFLKTIISVVKSEGVIEGGINNIQSSAEKEYAKR